ncbi:MAG: glycosyltransferase [Ilumatobacteraceae bacterium]
MAGARISLNVIAYNEEDRLEQCLSDARPHVDEIVVVDQMSTDATAAIAQRLADVYIRDAHHGHAEPSRELAASRSTGDWILVLDADETMSDVLKERLRDLVEGVADGYWIRKSNTVDGVETSTIHHLRLVRASRAWFDPAPHGGATVVSGNVEYFDEIGIIHPKSQAEQLYDDARYEQIAAEERASSSSKRNWLQHNRTLRAHRARSRRADLEALLPSETGRLLVVGDLMVDVDSARIVRVATTSTIGKVNRRQLFDAAVIALPDTDRRGALEAVAAVVRPDAPIVGTVPAARNLRRLEDTVSALVGEGGAADVQQPAGATRRMLASELDAAGLDARWMQLVHDGWLDRVPLRPDGSESIVESAEFLLRRVPAEVAEELSAAEIVFAAVPRPESEAPACSVVVAPIADGDASRFADALRSTAPRASYELVVVGGAPSDAPEGGRRVPAEPGASVAARWNAGARAAGGTSLVFVSGDLVPSPGWLDRLVSVAQSEQNLGAVGSKVVARDGTLEHAGLVIGPDAIPYRIHQGADASEPRVSRTRIVPAVAGDGMITSRARFVEVGGFDETLGDDLADADLCLRLRARGLPIVCSNAAGLTARMRSLGGARSQFRRGVREFSARWSGAAGSHNTLSIADGVDPSDGWNRSWRLPRPGAPAGGGLPAIAWSSHFYERGGYTEEAISTVEALDDAGLRVVANPVTYDRPWAPMPAPRAARLAALVDRDLPDDFVHVAHIGANRFKRHPDAMRNIGRTMFETDGLPAEWRDRCNLMDEIWVPCEHNLRSFAHAGVTSSKLHLVPETFDAEMFDPDVEPLAVEGLDGFVFLTVFSWQARKAWDVLLRAWFEEFDARDDVTLVLKTDTLQAPSGLDCRREIDRFVRDVLGRRPEKGAPIVVIDRFVETSEVPALYRAADAFVLASHGEGWGRPHMEAMAMGLPAIATRWGGNLEFMDDDNSCLVDCELVDAPSDTWMRGQRWAQPSVRDLRRAMRRLYEHPDEAAEIGARARADVRMSCRPELVVDAVRDRLEAIDRHPVHVSIANEVVGEGATASVGRRRSVKGTRRVNACVVVTDDGRFLGESLASLGSVADTIEVIDGTGHDDLASARNAGLDRIGEGWVLMLDSSQTLDPTSGAVVRELVQRGGFVGYSAGQRVPIGFDGAAFTIERRAVVLFPSHPELRYLGAANEQLVSRHPDVDLALARSTIVVHEHDRRPERRDPGVQARRILPALERAVRDDPAEPFHRYNLGCALADIGLHAEAEVNHRRAIDAAAPHAPWVPAAYVSLARAVGAQGRKAAAVKLCKKATKRAPDWPLAWCSLGQALLDAGRPQKALTAYSHALDCSGGGEGAPPVAWEVASAVGRVHFALGHHLEAADCLERALAASPGSDELRVLLARALEALGSSGESRRELELAVSRRSGVEAYMRFGDHFADLAQSALLRGLADNPESSALRERIELLRAR